MSSPTNLSTTVARPTKRALYFRCRQCSKRLKTDYFGGTRKLRCPCCGHVVRACQNTRNPLSSERACRRQPQREQASTAKKARTAALFGLTLILGLGAGLSISKARSRGFDDFGWRECKFPQMGLKVSLPRGPRIEKEDGVAAFAVRSDLPGSDIEFRLHFFPTKNGFTEMPSSTDQLQEGLLSDYPVGKILSSRSLQWHGRRAMEFRLQTGEGEAIRRFVFDDDGTYVLSVAGNCFAEHDQSIKHFLNSLELEEAADEPHEQVTEHIGKPRKLASSR